MRPPDRLRTPPVKVAFCSPMHLERDGIGVYSRNLHGPLSKLCGIEPFPLDHEYHPHAHFRRMAEKINRCDVLHVEHNFCYFNGLVPFREAFREFLRRVRIPRIVMYHELVDRIDEILQPRTGNSLLDKGKNAFLFVSKAAARPFMNRWWLPRYNADIFSMPERVVVHTAYRAGIIERLAPGARVSVMPHPVYVPLPADGSTDEGPVVPFAETDRVLTVVGFIDHRKDYVGVLKALLGLPEHFKLLVAGGVHDEREWSSPQSAFGRMMRFAEENGLGNRVHVTGFFPDSFLPVIMKRTHAVIAPFTQDHSSGSVNVGIAYSRPVIAYRTMLTEEMSGNGAGIICVEGWEQLVPLILNSLKEPDLLQSAIEAGNEYRVKYGFPAAASRFAKWYEEMIGPRGGG